MNVAESDDVTVLVSEPERLAIERGEVIVFIRQNLKLQQGRQGDDEDIVKQQAYALGGADASEAWWKVLQQQAW
jgi:hypothetical protein